MNPNFIPLDAVSAAPFDLDSIRIATPCRADWELMSGDDQVRHCKSCAKNVYNFSALTRADAVRLIQEKEGNLCVQLHRRTDGTLITADCAVGAATMTKPKFALRAVFAAGVAALLGVFGVSSAKAAPQKAAHPSAPAPLMGEVMPVKPTRGEPLMGKPTMGERTMGVPMMPASTPAPLLGRMVMPVKTPAAKKNASKNHAKHAAKPTGKSKSTPRH